MAWNLEGELADRSIFHFDHLA